MSVAPFALRSERRAVKEEGFRTDLSVRLSCPDCKTDNLQLSEEFGNGDLVCSTCGLVLGDKVVDTRSEWRSFADSEGDDPSRVGGPTDPLLDSADQFSTVISFRDGNTGVSKSLQSATSMISRNQGSGRDLSYAYEKLQAMCDNISLPRGVADTAKQLLKRADDEKLLRGKSLEAIIGACIYISCRRAHVPRTFKEICKLAGVSKKEVGNCFKLLEKTFETNPVHPTSASSIIPRYCNHLGLPMFIQSAASYVVERVTELGLLDGRNPITVNAASIFFTVILFAYTGRGSTAASISAVAGVQDSTIRTSYRILVKSKDQLVSPKWFDTSRAPGERADLNRVG